MGLLPKNLIQFSHLLLLKKSGLAGTSSAHRGHLLKFMSPDHAAIKPSDEVTCQICEETASQLDFAHFE